MLQVKVDRWMSVLLKRQYYAQNVMVILKTQVINVDNSADRNKFV